VKTKPCSCCQGTGQENDHRVIGGKLRQERLAADIEQQVIAKKLHISPQLLSGMEHGQRRWTQSRIDAYRKSVGMLIFAQQKKHKRNFGDGQKDA
jgi:predicted transcriptional regulator